MLEKTILKIIQIHSMINHSYLYAYKTHNYRACFQLLPHIAIVRIFLLFPGLLIPVKRKDC